MLYSGWNWWFVELIEFVVQQLLFKFVVEQLILKFFVFE